MPWVVLTRARPNIHTHTHIARPHNPRSRASEQEVVHAGIYYPQGGLKAEMCVEGKRRLYRYAESRGIPHSRCGKLIVATDPSQEAALVGARWPPSKPSVPLGYRRASVPWL